MLAQVYGRAALSTCDLCSCTTWIPGSWNPDGSISCRSQTCQHLCSVHHLRSSGLCATSETPAQPSVPLSSSNASPSPQNTVSTRPDSLMAPALSRTSSEVLNTIREISSGQSHFGPSTSRNRGGCSSSPSTSSGTPEGSAYRRLANRTSAGKRKRGVKEVYVRCKAIVVQNSETPALARQNSARWSDMLEAGLIKDISLGGPNESFWTPEAVENQIYEQFPILRTTKLQIFRAGKSCGLERQQSPEQGWTLSSVRRMVTDTKRLYLGPRNGVIVIEIDGTASVVDTAVMDTDNTLVVDGICTSDQQIASNGLPDIPVIQNLANEQSAPENVAPLSANPEGMAEHPIRLSKVFLTSYSTQSEFGHLTAQALTLNILTFPWKLKQFAKALQNVGASIRQSSSNCTTWIPGSWNPDGSISCRSQTCQHLCSVHHLRSSGLCATSETPAQPSVPLSSSNASPSPQNTVSTQPDSLMAPALSRTSSEVLNTIREISSGQSHFGPSTSRNRGGCSSSPSTSSGTPEGSAYRRLANRTSAGKRKRGVKEVYVRCKAIVVQNSETPALARQNSARWSDMLEAGLIKDISLGGPNESFWTPEAVENQIYEQFPILRTTKLQIFRAGKSCGLERQQSPEQGWTLSSVRRMVTDTKRLYLGPRNGVIVIEIDGTASVVDTAVMDTDNTLVVDGICTSDQQIASNGLPDIPVIQNLANEQSAPENVAPLSANPEGMAEHPIRQSDIPTAVFSDGDLGAITAEDSESEDDVVLLPTSGNHGMGLRRRSARVQRLNDSFSEVDIIPAMVSQFLAPFVDDENAERPVLEITDESNTFLEILQHFNETNISLSVKRRVRYANQNGVDAGGLSKDSSHAAWDQATSFKWNGTPLFEGDKLKVLTGQPIEDWVPRSVGKFLFVCIVHGYAFPSYLDESTFRYMIDEPVSYKRAASINDFIGTLFEKIDAAEGTRNFPENIPELAEWMERYEIQLPQWRDKTKEELKNEVARFELYTRRKSSILLVKEGLNQNGFLTALKDASMLETLCNSLYRTVETSQHVIEEMEQPAYSDQMREKELIAYGHLMRYVTDADITKLRHLMVFVTGFTRIPLHPKIKVRFYDTTVAHLPYAQTCFNVIRIGIQYRSGNVGYGQFVRDLERSIMESRRQFQEY